MLRSSIAFGFIAVIMTSGCGGEDDNDGISNRGILGDEPGFSNRAVTSVPNEDAIGTKIWVPGLDEGYIPQGLTFAGDQILVGVYQSINQNISEGPAKVFRVDPVTGEITGRFDLPSHVGHASGLAYAVDNVLYIADSVGLGRTASGKILKIDLKKAMEEGNCDGAILGEIILEGLMTPCFLTFDGVYLWFGTYSVNESDLPVIYKIDPDDVFETWPSVSPVFPDMAFSVFDIDMWIQGATFDKEGNLWLSQSTGNWGRIQKINPSNGDILEEYELMAGIEDLAVSPGGELWSVSEAGAIKYYSWNAYYPLIFQMDVTKLVE